jgi:hypothetical protein
MNTTKTKYEEALKIALEALEVSKPSWAGGKFLDDRISKHNDTIDVLRKLLAQPDIKHSNECIKNNWQVCSCGVEKTQPEQRSVSEHLEPVAYITPLMEQQMFDDWCPYKGNPDPRVVWAGAVEAVNGLLLGATPPKREPLTDLKEALVEAMSIINHYGMHGWSKAAHDEGERVKKKAEKALAAHGIKE